MININEPEKTFIQNDLTFIYGSNKEFSGLIFIGDPHLNYNNPGNRIDEYLDSILNKIKQISTICNKNNYLAIILGDLFHNLKYNEIQPEFLNKIILTFKEFKYPPILLIGNHDIKEKFNVSEKDAISIFENIGLFNFIRNNGLIGKIKVKYKDEKKVIAIGGTPFGYEVPTNLSPLVGLEGDAFTPLLNIKDEYREQQKEKIIKKLKVDKVIWLTHQKFNFNQYNSVIDVIKNTKTINEIIGVDMVVNGDIHNKFAPILVGNTLYFNPGNISRVKVDEIDNIPHISLWQPALSNFLSKDKNEENEMKTNIGTTTNKQNDKLVDLVLKYAPINEIFDLSFIEEEKNQEKSEINTSVFIDNLFKNKSTSQSDNEFDNLASIKDDILNNDANVYTEPTKKYIQELFSNVKNMLLNKD